MEIALFTDLANGLGESPVWDPRRGWLWWVDIRRNRVLAADAAGRLQRDWHYDRPVGSIGLAGCAKGGEGGLVAAVADHFSLIEDNGRETVLCAPGIGRGAIRFNDGKTDRQGRFLAGTMQHGGQEEPLASLWQLGRDHVPERLVRGLRLVNAICFSPCGRWLYFADTLEGVIRRHAYDPETGAMGEGGPFFDCRPIDAAPDGATVDAEGCLWVALVTSGQIACISPEGTLLRRIDLPVPYPACPAFGGADMATLYVTTIAELGHRLKSDHPDAGRMLAITGLGARGLAEAIHVPDNHT